MKWAGSRAAGSRGMTCREMARQEFKMQWRWLCTVEANGAVRKDALFPGFLSGRESLATMEVVFGQPGAARGRLFKRNGRQLSW